MTRLAPRPEYSPNRDRTDGERFVLRFGRFWTAAPLPTDVPRGERGECYLDALTRALTDPDQVYVEGLAWRADADLVWEDDDGVAHQLWTPHAWTVDPDDRVVDACGCRKPCHGL